MLRWAIRRAPASCLAASLGVLFLALPAAAQSVEGLDFERFKPATDSQGLMLTEGGQGEKARNYNLSLTLNYSNDPMVFYIGSEVVRELVSDRLSGDLYGSYAFTDWLSLGLAVPVIFNQNGVNPDRVSGADVGLSAFSIGDIRLSPKLTMMREEAFPLSLAFVMPISLPSGDKWEFTGAREDSLTVTPTLAASRHLMDGRLLLAANVGVWIRKGEDYYNLQTGDQLVYRLGLGMKASDLVMVFGELQGMSELENLFQNPRNQVYLEGFLGARMTLANGLQAHGGVGLPMQAGWGTPDFRVFFGLGWSPRLQEEPPEEPPPPADLDGDGVMDPDDRCVDVAGPVKNAGCPWPDTDQDGLNDAEDSCPKQAGPKENKGCPVKKEAPPPPPLEAADRDGDGMADSKDLCPDTPGVMENEGCPWADKDGDGINDKEDKCVVQKGPAENNGCPWPDKDGDGVFDKDDSCADKKGPADNKGCPWPDTDGDGIADRNDKCPKKAEDGKGAKPKDGCPGKSFVIVKKKKIEITKSIFFNSGKSSISRQSLSLLQELAFVIKAHPEIKLIRVEGHTDSRGSNSSNLRLSDRRANSVSNYLVEQGVERSRLEAVGYGESKPIASNHTARGRETNRRVVFRILKRVP